MQDKSISIWIKGRVQGVGFRYHTHGWAIKLGIKGWVRNMPDGSVYVEACGPQEKIDQFVSLCRQGPSMSKVSEFFINEIPFKEYTSFSIR